MILLKNPNVNLVSKSQSRNISKNENEKQVITYI